METKFKPNGVPDEYLKLGAYFKSENNVTTQYLVELCEGKALVKIYTTDILDNHFETEDLEIGDTIGLFESYLEWIAEVDLYPKYFFPKFNNELQLSYDDEKYYGRDYKSNSITSLMECINFAIEYGLNKYNIVPY